MSPPLNTSPNFQDPDRFYAAFVAAHNGLTEEASALLNARLVLILANQIGDPDLLEDALTLARSALSVRTRAASKSQE